MPGPDLPTGGIIFQKNTSEIDGIRSYYETGKGTIIVRGKIHKVCDDKPGSIKLVVTEVPYGVGPEQFVEDINKHRDEFEDIAQVINLSSNTTCIEISLNKNADVDNVIERYISVLGYKLIFLLTIHLLIGTKILNLFILCQYEIW
jgi:DNA gyrase subunit A